MAPSNRMTDSELQHRIEKLIESEENTHDRAQLLILLQLSNLLIDNIVSVREIANEFKTHRKDFEEHVEQQNKIFNRGWGLWKALAVVAVIAQIIIGGFITELRSTLTSHSESIVMLEREIAVIKEKVPEGRVRTYNPETGKLE